MVKASISMEDILSIDRVRYPKLESSIRSIIYSKLKHLPDIHDYIDDLVSDAFLVVLRSVKRYNSSKSKFSTYVYNRVVASSKKLYLVLKFPYGGIKALTGQTRDKVNIFLDSDRSKICSIDELDLELPDNYTEEEDFDVCTE